MKTKAAILVDTTKPLAIEEIETPPLKPGQALVEIIYSGVCHTQVLECRGYRGEDRFIPHCLGHEGTGRVLETGPDVKKVREGDTVILSWIKGSGGNVPGSVYKWNGKDVNAGGVTTFQKHAVVSENRLTVLGEGMPAKESALIGCALATGAGAVINAAKAGPADSLAVFGTGGVGLCAVAGAALSGCVPLIAVDIKKNKLELARELGATHTVDASREDVAEAIRKIAPGGVDFAIEASGRPQVMRAALECVRPQGGAAVIIGNARHGEEFSFNPQQLNQGKSLIGTWGGDTDPDRDFPKYSALIAAGKLALDPLITKIYNLDSINDALDDLESGSVIRPLIDLSGE